MPWFSRRPGHRHNRGRVAESSALPEMAMWFGDLSLASSAIYGLTSGQLATGSTSVHVKQVPLPLTGRTIVGGVFDGSGNLWCWSGRGSTNVPQFVVMFTPSSLRRRSGTPDRTITLPSGDPRYDLIWDATFDGSGNLWMVLDIGLWKLTPAQLASSGSPTPTEFAFIDINAAYGIGGAFQSVRFHGGSCYVTCYGDAGNNGGLFRIAEARLGGASDPAFDPGSDAVFNDTNIESRGPCGMAVDSVNSRLWIACWRSQAACAWNLADLVATGDPAPAIVLTSAGNFTGPQGVLLDSARNLWVSNVSDPTTEVDVSPDLVRIPVAQTGSTAAVTPDSVISAGIPFTMYATLAPGYTP